MKRQWDKLTKEELITIIEAIDDCNAKRAAVDTYVWDDAFCGVSDTFLKERYRLLDEHTKSCNIVNELLDKVPTR